MNIKIRELNEGTYSIIDGGYVKKLEVVEDTSGAVIYGHIPGTPGRFLSPTDWVEITAG